MLVENLSRCLREALARIPSGELAPEAEAGIAGLLKVLELHAESPVEEFLARLAKVKPPRPPKKSAEEKAREKAEKADAKAAEKLRKAEETAAQKAAAATAKVEAKALAKTQKLDEAAARKAAAVNAKAEAKLQVVAAKAEAKAAAKVQATAAKVEAKAAEAQARLAMADRAVQTVTDDLKALLMRFRGGNVPQEAVDGELNKLLPFKAPQLFEIAKALNSDATLTEKSAKPKILKQIAEMVRRVWKTSDNVNH